VHHSLQFGCRLPYCSAIGEADRERDAGRREEQIVSRLDDLPVQVDGECIRGFGSSVTVSSSGGWLDCAACPATAGVDPKLDAATRQHASSAQRKASMGIAIEPPPFAVA
jgi:hypothetical protein